MGLRWILELPDTRWGKIKNKDFCHGIAPNTGVHRSPMEHGLERVIINISPEGEENVQAPIDQIRGAVASYK